MWLLIYTFFLCNNLWTVTNVFFQILIFCYLLQTKRSSPVMRIFTYKCSLLSLWKPFVSQVRRFCPLKINKCLKSLFTKYWVPKLHWKYLLNLLYSSCDISFVLLSSIKHSYVWLKQFWKNNIRSYQQVNSQLNKVMKVTNYCPNTFIVQLNNFFAY